MYTNADLTIFHRSVDIETGDDSFKALYIEAVFFENNKNTNKSAAGLEDADQALILIPSVNDYLTPIEYKDQSEPAGFWAVKKGDIVVKGDATTTPFANLESEFNDVLTVTSVDERLFGSQAMQHVEVGAK